MLYRNFLQKVQLQNKDELFVLSDYSDNVLSLKVLNLKLNNAFVGQLSDSDIRIQSASIRQTHQEFIRNVKQALFNDSRNKTIIYFLDEVSSEYVFKWKSIDEEETIILLGSVPLHDEESTCVIDTVLSLTSLEMCKMNNQLNSATKDLEICKSQIAKNILDFKSATVSKEKLESEMYSKFVLVLNEKKRRIRMLQQKVKSSGTQMPSVSRVRRFPNNIATDSSSDDDEESRDNDENSARAARNSLEFVGENDVIESTSRKRTRFH